MTKKIYNLIVGIIGGLSTIAVAFVTYVEPSNAVGINSAIGIGCTALIEICSKFVKDGIR